MSHACISCILWGKPERGRLSVYMSECVVPTIPYLNTVQVALQFRLRRRLSEWREPKDRESAEH